MDGEGWEGKEKIDRERGRLIGKRKVERERRI